MANVLDDKEQVPDDEDFTHVSGTGANLDWRPHYDGPLPRSMADCFFSLLVQLVSERYSFNGNAASLCLDFVDPVMAAQFLRQLSSVLHRCKSAVSQVDKYVELFVHDSRHEHRTTTVASSVWTYARAVYCDGNDRHDAEDQEIAGEELYRHSVAPGKNRQRIVLVYANRMRAPGDQSSQALGYCVSMHRVPAVDKAMLVRELVAHCEHNNIRFESSTHDMQISSRALFHQYIAAYGEAVEQYVNERAHERAMVEAADEIELGRRRDDALNVTVIERPPIMVLSSELLEVLERVHTCQSSNAYDARMEQLHSYRTLLSTKVISMSPDQRFVMYLVLDRRDNIFLSGSAGCGKTYIERVLIQELELRNVQHAVTGTTGKASVLAGGSIIHRWAGVGLADEGFDAALQNMYQRGGGDPNNNRCLSNWMFTEALFIDEISMASTPLFDILDRIGRSVRKRETQMFGGIQLVCVGDYAQLPPIYDRRKWKKPPEKYFCFQLDQWNQGFKWQIELSKIFRQNDRQFIELLNALRFGKLSRDQLQLLTTRMIERMDKQELDANEMHKLATCICSDNRTVNAINQRELAKLDTEEHTFYWQVEFTPKRPFTSVQRDAVVNTFDRDLPVEKQITLKVGARVLCAVNYAPDKGVINGSSGTIVAFVKENGKPPIMPLDAGVPLYPSVLFDGHDYPMVMKPFRWYRWPEKATKSSSSSRSSGGSASSSGDKMQQQRLEDMAKAQQLAASAGAAKQGDDFKDWDAYAAQIPLRLGWSITIHRSQGMTIKYLLVYCSKIWERGQFYVAVSRGESLEGIFLQGFNPRQIVADPRVVNYYERLRYLKEYLFRPYKKQSAPRAKVLDNGKRQRRAGVVDEEQGQRVEDDEDAFMRDALRMNAEQSRDGGDRPLTQEQKIDMLRDDPEFAILFADLFRIHRLQRSRSRH